MKWNLLLIFVFWLSQSGTPATGEERLSAEQVRERFDSIEAWSYSSGGKRIIHHVKKGGKSFLVIDGKVREIDYTPFLPAAFSENEASFALTAVRGNVRYVTQSLCKDCPEPKESFCDDLVDSGKMKITERGELFEIEMRKEPVHVRCVPQHREWFVLHDGKERKAEQASSIDSLTLSPDGKRLAYMVEYELHHQVLVLDGKTIDLGKRGVTQSKLVFSSDSRHFYASASLYDPATRRSSGVLIVDGAVRGPYREVPDLESCGTRYLASIGKKNGRYLVWESGKSGPYKDTRLFGFAGPDCKGAAAVVQRGKKNAFWYNNEIYGWYDEMGDFKISRDGKRVAFYAYVLHPPDDFEASSLKPVVVVDGVTGKIYEEIDFHDDFVFSPDGSRYAYIAKRKGKGSELETFVIVDGKEHGPYSPITHPPIFSKNGSHIAFGVEEGTDQFMYLDFRKIHDDGSLWNEITIPLDDGSYVVKDKPRF